MTDDLLRLLESAPAPAMDLDENAVLSGGRRRQRRRRLGRAASVVAAVAVVAGGWWVGAGSGSSGGARPGGTDMSVVTTSAGTLELALGSAAGTTIELWHDRGSVNAGAAREGQNVEVGVVARTPVDERGRGTVLTAFGHRYVLLVTSRKPTALTLRTAAGSSPWGSASPDGTDSGRVPGTTLWATLADADAVPDGTPGTVSWRAADGTQAVAPVGPVVPAVSATGTSLDQTLEPGRAREVTTMNGPGLPAAVERFTASVTAPTGATATARVTPESGPDAADVALAPGAPGAFVLPVARDATSRASHVYGLVRAGIAEVVVSGLGGSAVPEHWSTSSFPVVGTDVVLVVITVDTAADAGSRWAVTWQSVDGEHSQPVAVR